MSPRSRGKAGAARGDMPPYAKSPRHATQTKAIAPFDAGIIATACRTSADAPNAPCGDPKDRKT